MTNNFKPLACGFHSHLDFSLDGASTASAKIINAANQGRIADCVTDHGVMSGLVSHWTAAQKLYKDKKIDRKIQSIHGIEAYIIDPHRPWKTIKKTGKQEPQYFHVTIHFKTKRAYEYFCSLTPMMEQRAIVRFGEAKPLLTLDELEVISGEVTIGSGCFLPGTQIQTFSGLKKIESVEKGERVLSPNGSWSNVFTPTTRKYKGKMYKIHCEGLLEPICATPNHEFLKRVGGDSSEWTSAETLIKGDFLQLVVENYDLTEDNYYKLYTDKRKRIFSQNLYDNDFLMIFGFFIAQGSFGSRSTLNFSGHATKDIYFFNLIEKWAIGHNINFSYRNKTQNSRDIIIFSKNAFDLFLDLFEGRTNSTTKKIPSIFKKLPEHKLKKLLFGYFCGDGHVGYRADTHKKGGKYITRITTATSTSQQLIDDVAAILRRIGLNYYVYKKAAYTSKKKINHKTWWSISCSGIESDRFQNWVNDKFDLKFSGKYYKQVKKIELFDYDGDVHCLSVPGPESFTLIGGLIVHNCLVGCVQKNILNGRSDWAKENYERLRAIAGKGNFFVEVFPHQITHNWTAPKIHRVGRVVVIDAPGKFDPITTLKDWDANAVDPDPCTGHTIDIQKIPNFYVLAMAKKYGDPVVISLDDHYATEGDKVVQECRLGNGSERWKFYGSYASHDTDTCALALKEQLGVNDRDIEEWVDNSYKFVELFKNYTLETSKDRLLLPSTEMVYNVTTDSVSVLHQLVKKHGRMPKENSPEYQVYKDRFDYELSVLNKNGVADFLPYFFVLEDAASFAKSNNIMWNTRGSAGGSLILFLLGISITDPIKYDLPFERFLTLGRIKSGSLPDIDSDWEDRDVILDYMQKKYKDSYALIATNLLLRLKSSIKDVERATLGMVLSETDDMCRMIPSVPQGLNDIDWLMGYTDKNTGAHIKGYWEEDVAGSYLLREWAKKNPELWDTVQKCIGITKTRGVHAGGVVLTPGPVQNYMPIMKTEKGLATSYEMKAVETIGAVKYDFLGVKTLKALGIAIKSLKSIGVNLEWKEFPNDPNVIKNVIAGGKLAGIFQLNTRTVAPFVAQIQPKNIKEIALLTSLVRPGALDAPVPDPNVIYEDEKKRPKTAAEYYVHCAQGLRKPYFIHDDLKPILGDTYGVIVTQEQSLKIFRDLADYTYETAEEIRRGIGKKDKDLLSKHMNVLKEKCLLRGWSEQQVEILIESLMKSANYAFNCLEENTRIITNKGIKTLNNIKIGDFVLSNGDNCAEFKEVTEFKNFGEKDVYDVELSDGQKICATPDHKFLSNGEWRTLKEIIDMDLGIDQCEKK